MQAAETMKAAFARLKQDMKPGDVVRVARAIGEAIGDWGWRNWDYSWAAKMSMRKQPPPGRHPVSVAREIRALEDKRRSILRRANESADRIEARIDKLRDRLSG